MITAYVLLERMVSAERAEIGKEVSVDFKESEGPERNKGDLGWDRGDESVYITQEMARLKSRRQEQVCLEN